MPLPLAPLAALALRTGAVAGAVWLVRRALVPGRTDQRAEDALDDLGEGLSLHRPADRALEGARQTNAAGRFRRTLTWAGGGIEIDAAWLARLRIRRT
ncbi:hypothetical protein [Cereibacter johrii]|uniref:Uncharacterized protein n=1 Tax=Cereibacter johrii TaxID=445629 RepID=A0ABX5J4H7_9RHOB|nr:hypothetical protein [Cereibacter johrii]ODM42047.1 hypothetical protein A9O63_09550 [Cereibacter johrii]PTM77501.1 hypothetical protein C8J29_10515 [Cereibacter johrii]QCP87149.1 hypothetical protein EYE35_16060 [Cereibacter sphaeroides]RDS93447.1 hypothetical protein DWF04_19990 [Cereibacter sphaeroides f. sp. denitrificans]